MTGQPTALITGAGGQDGTLLVAELARRGWRTVAVYGPGTTAPEPPRPESVSLTCDLSDIPAAGQLIDEYAPTHVFHLAAISSVAASWADPVGTAHLNGVLSVALADRCLRQPRPPRFVNASSGEIFAAARRTPQDESTPLAPNSPYGAAKAFAHSMVVVFRARGLWASNAILYNHESPCRPTTFVTRKITSGVAAIAAGSAQRLTLGNLDARRDWGWAPDYVEAMIRIAEHDTPDDFVLATGTARSVRDFVHEAFAAVGITDWRHLVDTSEQFTRPADATALIGDSTHARRTLRWSPTMSFPEIVRAMVRHDLDLIGAGHHDTGAGTNHDDKQEAAL
ncbi:NAD-dependent epimerase/dehydratase family protein [Gordonia amarae]|uniref:GDP-mannose 4,6-dehydratase n=2 Tax=Gordonia amarae TaxID=36821 RepID=G7GQW7_9ACTN|nr:GDP-mannose 4,6-dehydratase [Gordonia amarae]MCS3877589.1 GDPmannose 4,6-dehydratase [Gordonia amarae]QHN16306.1 NAD-dependent epimerase/dehydratase family protein [Gordonia amarae]QHN20875.1 NAD-dependent epimerase/dehydratase family protein [Gordonia amarae]QHN29726.1 NAD-dependent epimerase/dehydratase family protein [Gordonia amarae]QHN38501.1 NAD-dependent epimerase/dehydratase family protein [Gordonia amarae]